MNFLDRLNELKEENKKEEEKRKQEKIDKVLRQFIYKDSIFVNSEGGNLSTKHGVTEYIYGLNRLIPEFIENKFIVTTYYINYQGHSIPYYEISLPLGAK